MKRVILSAIAAGFVMAPAMGQDLLWENPDTNGVNGVSNATEAPFGFRRQVLDDFELAQDSTITSIEWDHIWNSFPVGSGEGLELRFRADNGGTPGDVIVDYVNVTSYNEVATGRNWFGRDEAHSTAIFDGVDLGAGTYWIDATIVGPENNFWMVSDIATLAPMWVDYADFGGLQPGSNIFGADYQLDFELYGTTGGGGFTLTVTGDCPGTLTASTTGGSPNTFTALIFARGTGNVAIPNGNPCAGTILGLDASAQLVAQYANDSNGDGSFTGRAPAFACGGFLQALDVASCTPSDVAGI